MVFHIMLGTIDLLCAIALAAIVLGHPFPQFQAGMALALIGKGVLFITDILSIIDIIIGISMFWFFWHSADKVALGMAIFLAFKGLYSFV